MCSGGGEDDAEGVRAAAEPLSAQPCAQHLVAQRLRGAS